MANKKMNKYAMYAMTFVDGGHCTSLTEACKLAAPYWRQMPASAQDEWKQKADTFNEEALLSEELLIKQKKISNEAKQRKKERKFIRELHPGCSNSEDQDPISIHVARKFYLPEHEELWRKKRVDDMDKLEDLKRQQILNMDNLCDDRAVYWIISVTPYFETSTEAVPAEVSLLGMTFDGGINEFVHHWLVDPCDMTPREMELHRTYHKDHESENFLTPELLCGNQKLKRAAVVYKELWDIVSTQEYVFLLGVDYNLVNKAFYWLREQAEGFDETEDYADSEKFKALEDLAAAFHFAMDDLSSALEVDRDMDLTVENRMKRWDLHPEMTCMLHLEIKKTDCAVSRGSKSQLLLLHAVRDMLAANICDYFPRVSVQNEEPTLLEPVIVKKSAAEVHDPPHETPGEICPRKKRTILLDLSTNDEKNVGTTQVAVDDSIKLPKEVEIRKTTFGFGPPPTCIPKRMLRQMAKAGQ